MNKKHHGFACVIMKFKLSHKQSYDIHCCSYYIMKCITIPGFRHHLPLCILPWYIPFPFTLFDVFTIFHRWSYRFFIKFLVHDDQNTLSCFDIWCMNPFGVLPPWCLQLSCKLECLAPVLEKRLGYMDTKSCYCTPSHTHLVSGQFHEPW